MDPDSWLTLVWFCFSQLGIPDHTLPVHLSINIISYHSRDWVSLFPSRPPCSLPVDWVILPTRRSKGSLSPKVDPDLFLSPICVWSVYMSFFQNKLFIKLCGFKYILYLFYIYFTCFYHVFYTSPSLIILYCYFSFHFPFNTCYT